MASEATVTLTYDILPGRNLGDAREWHVRVRTPSAALSSFTTTAPLGDDVHAVDRRVRRHFEATAESLRREIAAAQAAPSPGLRIAVEPPAPDPLDASPLLQPICVLIGTTPGVETGDGATRSPTPAGSGRSTTTT